MDFCGIKWSRWMLFDRIRRTVIESSRWFRLEVTGAICNARTDEIGKLLANYSNAYDARFMKRSWVISFQWNHVLSLFFFSPFFFFLCKRDDLRSLSRAWVFFVSTKRFSKVAFVTIGNFDRHLFFRYICLFWLVGQRICRRYFWNGLRA